MRIPSFGTPHDCVTSLIDGSSVSGNSASISPGNGSPSLANPSSSSSSSGASLLCKFLPSGYRYLGPPDGQHPVLDSQGRPVKVVFSAQSRDAIIYVTVVLVIYIVIFVVLVVASYRKSNALRETLNRHLRHQYATGPVGTPTILESDSRGRQVHCDTVDELHEGSIQL